MNSDKWQGRVPGPAAVPYRSSSSLKELQLRGVRPNWKPSKTERVLVSPETEMPERGQWLSTLALFNKVRGWTRDNRKSDARTTFCGSAGRENFSIIKKSSVSGSGTPVF